MNLTVTYDTNTLATAPSGFFSAVNYVVSLYDTTFSNNATVNIEVGYGDFPYDGSSLTSDLGESQQNNIVSGNYTQVRRILINEGASGASTLPLSSPINGTLQLGSAQEKALGLIGSSSALDGWVGIASDAELQQLDGNSWSFSSTATPGATEVYLVGVIEHEFSEVMGRTSFLDTRGEYGILDLYRYASAGVRQTGTGDPAYFSIDGGFTNLDSFNNARVAAGDLGDWAPNAGPSGVFQYAGADAFDNNSLPGQINGLTSTDLTLMAALGWETTPPCYCRGTLILTDRGEVPVERLAIGDRVATLSGACKPVVWIGFGRSLVTRRNSEARPIIVRRGALADNVPARDLYLSHGHALYFEGALIPAEHLVNHRSILWDDAARVVEYYHVELADHDVLFAEGAPAETYHDSGNRAFFHNARPGAGAGADKPTFAPVLHDGDRVGAVWAGLFARAGGRIERNTTADADLHLVLDGERIDPTAIAGGVCHFAVPRPPAATLRLRSRAGVPSLLGFGRHDHRPLGIAIKRIILNHAGIATSFDYDAPQLREGGCHPPEDGYSWTDGDLDLPMRFFTLLNGSFTLAVHTKPHHDMRYPMSPLVARAA